MELTNSVELLDSGVVGGLLSYVRGVSGIVAVCDVAWRNLSPNIVRYLCNAVGVPRLYVLGHRIGFSFLKTAPKDLPHALGSDFVNVDVCRFRTYSLAYCDSSLDIFFDSNAPQFVIALTVSSLHASIFSLMNVRIILTTSMFFAV